MKRILLSIWIVVSFLGIGVIAGYVAVGYPPVLSPAAFVKAGTHEGRKTVVCVGDSITHGRVSADYVAMLRERLGPGYTVVNAGVNGELAYNVLERIDEVVSCRPDFVTILIGTNDANNSSTPERQEQAVRSQRLPSVPTEDDFVTNLEEIVSILRRETKAEIALISIPPIGEDPTQPLYSRSARFAKRIEDVAQRIEDAATRIEDVAQRIEDVTTRNGVSYLPLFEAMDAEIRKAPLSYELNDRTLMRRMYGAIVLRHLLGYDYARISRRYGYSLHADDLHLNDRGASIAAELIRDFVISEDP